MGKTKKMSLLAGAIALSMAFGCGGSNVIDDNTGNSDSFESEYTYTLPVDTSNSESASDSEYSSESDSSSDSEESSPQIVKEKFSVSFDCNVEGGAELSVVCGGQTVTEVEEDESYSITVASTNANYAISVIAIGGQEVFSAQPNSLTMTKTIDSLIMPNGGTSVSVTMVKLATVSTQGLSENLQVVLFYGDEQVDKVEVGSTYSLGITCTDNAYGIVSVTLGGQTVYTATENAAKSFVKIDDLVMGEDTPQVSVQLVGLNAVTFAFEDNSYNNKFKCEILCDDEVVNGVQEGKTFSIRISSLMPLNYYIYSIYHNGVELYNSNGNAYTITKRIDDLVMSDSGEVINIKVLVITPPV